MASGGGAGAGAGAGGGSSAGAGAGTVPQARPAATSAQGRWVPVMPAAVAPPAPVVIKAPVAASAGPTSKASMGLHMSHSNASCDTNCAEVGLRHITRLDLCDHPDPAPRTVPPVSAHNTVAGAGVCPLQRRRRRDRLPPAQRGGVERGGTAGEAPPCAHGSICVSRPRCGSRHSGCAGKGPCARYIECCWETLVVGKTPHTHV